jgi:hypothetical protein
VRQSNVTEPPLRVVPTQERLTGSVLSVVA